MNDRDEERPVPFVRTCPIKNNRGDGGARVVELYRPCREAVVSASARYVAFTILLGSFSPPTEQSVLNYAAKRLGLPPQSPSVLKENRSNGYKYVDLET